MEFQRKPVNEIGIILVREHATPCRTGAVNKDIAATKHPAMRVKHRLAPFKRPQIGGMSLNPAVRLRGDGPGRRRAIGLAAASDHDIRPLTRQALGDGKADAPRAS